MSLLPRRSTPAKLLAGLALLIGVSLLGAAPASADPAGPSDFRSQVTRVEPAAKGVDAEIRGGDTFLELTVGTGHEVVVKGYSGEPYLRFQADGTVQRNARSAATYLNNSRKGKGTVPLEAQDPKAEPVWKDIASGGHYAWHDHRVHWMADTSPPVARGQRVTGAYDPWRVPIVVDGTATEVQGTLTYEHAMSPLPWALVALVAAGLVGWFGRRHAVRTAGAALLLVGLASVVVGRADFSATPDGGGNPLLWALPVVGVLAAVVALARAGKGTAVVAVLASVATLSSWALLRFTVLTKPVLPTDLPLGLDRGSTAAALGIAVAAAYLAVTSGGLRLPELPDD
jgi:hypothetical protein